MTMCTSRPTGTLRSTSRRRCHRGDEAREQRRGAVALVIVRAPFDLPWTHRQQRLRAIESLYLALLIDADHQRLVGRIEIEPDDVAHLLDELWIGGELERLRTMRLQRERPPDALHRGGRDTRRLCHVAGAPVRRARRLL